MILRLKPIITRPPDWNRERKLLPMCSDKDSQGMSISVNQTIFISLSVLASTIGN